MDPWGPCSVPAPAGAVTQHMRDIFRSFHTVRTITTLDPPRGLLPNLGPNGIGQKLDKDIPVTGSSTPNKLRSSANVTKVRLPEIASSCCSIMQQLSAQGISQEVGNDCPVPLLPSNAFPSMGTCDGGAFFSESQSSQIVSPGSQRSPRSGWLR